MENKYRVIIGETFRSLDKAKTAIEKDPDNMSGGMVFVFRSSDDFEINDIICIHELKSYKYFRVCQVIEQDMRYSHKETRKLKMSISNEEKSEYWEIKTLIEGPRESIMKYERL